MPQARLSRIWTSEQRAVESRRWSLEGADQLGLLEDVPGDGPLQSGQAVPA